MLAHFAGEVLTFEKFLPELEMCLSGLELPLGTLIIQVLTPDLY